MIQRWNMVAALAALTAVLITPADLLAQSGAGTIQGTIQDATAAAIPGTAVQALNQATGVVIVTTTNMERSGQSQTFRRYRTTAPPIASAMNA